MAKKSKIITSIFICVFISITFCGCLKNDASANSDRIKYYACSEDSICDIINKYNNYCAEHLDKSYQIEIVEFDSQEDMNLKISTEVMSGGGPDILSLSQKLPFEKFAKNETLLDINKLIAAYDYDIGLGDCSSAIMNAEELDGKRYFIPLFYSPDVFISTEQTLKKYNLTSSDFSFKALSHELSDSKSTYSLLGGTDYCLNLFYSFLDQYIDYNSGSAEFNTDEFSENLDCIYSLIKNDSSDENIYYFLYENINNGASVLYKAMPSFDSLVRTYSFLEYLGGSPVLVNNYKRGGGDDSASVDVGLAFNNNCKNKDKLLPFIKYCLSYDLQKDLSIECLYLPVNRRAMDYCIELTNYEKDFDEDSSVSDMEKAVGSRARSAAIKDYKDIINSISECNLYRFDSLSETYFNSSVIGDIVNKYLKGDISKEKFIRQLTAATEIYLTE